MRESPIAIVSVSLLALVMSPWACAGDEAANGRACRADVECAVNASCFCDGTGELVRVERALEDGREVTLVYEDGPSWAYADVMTPGEAQQRFRYVRTPTGEATRLEVSSDGVVNSYGIVAGRDLVGSMERTEDGFTVRWAFDYDPRGRVTSRRFDADADGVDEQSWSCVWSPAGALLSAGVDVDADGVTDARISYEGHDVRGAPERSHIDVDADGVADERVDGFVAVIAGSASMRVSHCEAPSLPVVP